MKSSSTVSLATLSSEAAESLGSAAAAAGLAEAASGGSEGDGDGPLLPPELPRDCCNPKPYLRPPKN